MNIKTLTKLATELAHITVGSPEASDMLKEEVRLLATDCKACTGATLEQLDILTRCYKGLLKRAHRAGIVPEQVLPD